MRLVALTLAMALASLATAVHARAVVSRHCLAGLGPALVAVGFSGSVDCKHDRLAVHPVGRIKSAGHTFAIYDYRYQLAPACPGCAVHGGQRIIIMRDGRYLGQYKPERVRVSVRNDAMILVPRAWPNTVIDPAYRPVAIRFLSGAPPATVWVGGEFIDFFQ